MRKLIFATLLPLVALIASSQENFSKAKIHKTDGQVLDVYIRNTAREATPQKFSYTLQPNGNLTEITVTTISKVVFEDGQTFERFEIKVPAITESYANRTAEMYKSEGNFFSGNTLLEKLISGTVSLYHLKDRFGFDHFFYKTSEDGSPVHLPNQTYSEANILKNDNSYKNLLSFLVQKFECKSSVSNKIERLQYALNPMMSVVRDINACSGSSSDINNAEYKRGTKVQAGIMAGLSSTDLKFVVGNSSHPGLTDDKFSNSIAPMFGGYLSFLPRHRVKSYVASIEVFYHMYKSETDSIHVNADVAGKGIAKFSTVNLSPNIRFLLTRNKIVPFIEAGVSVNVVVSEESEYRYRSLSTVYSKPIFTLKGFGISGLVGAGVDFSKGSGHIRYQIPVNRTGGYFSAFYATLKWNLKN